MSDQAQQQCKCGTWYDAEPLPFYRCTIWEMIKCFLGFHTPAHSTSEHARCCNIVMGNNCPKCQTENLIKLCHEAIKKIPASMRKDSYSSLRFHCGRKVYERVKFLILSRESTMMDKRDPLVMFGIPIELDKNLGENNMILVAEGFKIPKVSVPGK